MACGVDEDGCCWAARLTVIAQAALRVRSDELIGI